MSRNGSLKVADDDRDVEEDLAQAVGNDDDEDQDDNQDDDRDDSSDNDDSDDDSDDSDEELGERGKRALDRMKQERKRLRAELAEAKKIAKKWEDSQKTEAQRLADNAKEHSTRAEKAERKLARLEIAMEKGLTAKQAARLQGDTREELEQDADELLELFRVRAEKQPSRKPKEKLSGGGDPDTEREETDPRKLAASISRNRF